MSPQPRCKDPSGPPKVAHALVRAVFALLRTPYRRNPGRPHECERGTQKCVRHEASSTTPSDPLRSPQPCYICKSASMTSTSVTEIVCAHSPDSDDAYMFYGLATKKIRSRLVTFRHVLEDIETLNRKASEGALRTDRDFLPCLPICCGQVRPDGQRIEHRRRLRAHPGQHPPHGPGGDQREEDRHSRPHDQCVSHAEVVRAGLRRSCHSFRQDSRRRRRPLRRRRPCHSRGPAHLRPQRFSKRSGSGALVEKHLRSPACRWAATYCCDRFPRT